MNWDMAATWSRLPIMRALSLASRPAHGRVSHSHAFQWFDKAIGWAPTGVDYDSSVRFLCPAAKSILQKRALMNV